MPESLIEPERLKKSKSTTYKQKSCLKSTKTFALCNTTVNDNLPKNAYFIDFLMGTVFLNERLVLEYLGVCRKIVKR